MTRIPASTHTSCFKPSTGLLSLINSGKIDTKAKIQKEYLILK